MEGGIIRAGNQGHNYSKSEGIRGTKGHSCRGGGGQNNNLDLSDKCQLKASQLFFGLKKISLQTILTCNSRKFPQLEDLML